MKKKAGYIVLSVMLLTFAICVAVRPDKYVTCCFEGFAMWAECVLPALFPFMCITLIFVKTGIAEKASLPLKKVTGKLNFPPAAAACFILSVCSGYPAGSRTVAEFYSFGAFSKSESGKVAYLCSTSGPLFIIGSVGSKMFQNPVLGVKILLAHVFSIVAVSLIIALISKKTTKKEVKRNIYKGNVLYDSFYGAVTAVAVAGGVIAFFFVAANLLADLKIFYPLEKLFSLFLSEEQASALCLGLVEATTGCRALSACGGKISAALSGFLITFGGASILLQQLSYLLSAGVKPFKFISVKFLQGMVCFLILILIA